MAKCTIRYWASAKEAAGTAEETVEADSSRQPSKRRVTCTPTTVSGAYWGLPRSWWTRTRSVGGRTVRSRSRTGL